MKETGADVIGLDWRIPLDAGWEQIGSGAVQGNLDPVALFADPHLIENRAQGILDHAAGRPGHIFNLGHGILPETPVDNVKALVKYVQENSWTAGRAS
jgi:uroporphyrinogen decarboxylase